MSKSEAEQLVDSQDKEVRLPEIHLNDRFTPELVIAFTGPIGSGCTHVAQRLKKIVQYEYGYTPNYIPVSPFIAHFAGENEENEWTAFERVRRYQKAGNDYRQQHGADVLAKHVVNDIHRHREAKRGFRDQSPALLPIPEPRRVVHVIDSLKNPAEYRTLAQVYGGSLWLIAVFAPHDTRRKRLSNGGFTKAEIETAIEIDENEPFDYGQKVRKTVEFANFFIRNDSDQKGSVDVQLRRFMNLILGVGVVTPTIHEKGMAVASSAARSSACLSRQVGAAVYSKEGELLGIGANDVPRFGGGLYNAEDLNDARCFNWRNGNCHNDLEKGRLANQVVSVLTGLIPPDKVSEAVRRVRKSRLADLVEFSRAVHAEMEAIVSVARSGRRGVVEGRLYTTTYPCHNCARHIVAAGISEVYYIEPYPKSLASDLHDDSISTSSKDRGTKCVFLQYEGVAPKNIESLFRIKKARKQDGRALEVDPVQAVPMVDTPLDAIHEREDIVLATLPRLLETDDVKEGSSDSRRSTDVHVAPDNTEAGPAGSRELS